MYQYNKIKVIHLEVTDKCNASCPQCLRNNNGVGVNPYLAITELTLDDIKKVFEVDFIKQLKRMYMCGNYGDPIAARDTLSIYKYFRENNPEMKLSMNTNGSLKNAKWWQELAEVFGENGEVKFGLDGLKDTHSIYRQGIDWQKVVDNAKVFISAGGQAVWEFIIFKHNEHQIEEARELSKELGFSRFVTKKTWRFFSNVKNKGKNEHEVTARTGDKVLLKRPSNNNLNPALAKEGELKEKYGSLKNYLDKAIINCRVKNEKNLYISAEGLLLPCCWLANQLYIAYLPEKSTPIWLLIKDNGGIDLLNAKKYSLKKIVNGEFFQKIIPNSWTKFSIKAGRLEPCAKICGSEFNPFSAQYE